MRIEYRVSARVSGLEYHVSEDGQVWVLLHLAPESGVSKHKSKKMRPHLPPSPRSWIVSTAKTYRSGLSAYQQLLDFYRKKSFGWRDEYDIEESFGIFPEPLSYNGRSHYWQAVRVLYPNLPVSSGFGEFDGSIWLNAYSIDIVAAGTDMTKGWKDMYAAALQKSIHHQPLFEPIYRAFQAART